MGSWWLDLHSRRVVGFGMGARPRRPVLARACVVHGIAVRGGQVRWGGVPHRPGWGVHRVSCSPRRAGGPGSPSPLATPGRLWTTRWPRRSTPPWSSSCCGITTLTPGRRPAGRSPSGSTSTTSASPFHRRHAQPHRRRTRPRGRADPTATIGRVTRARSSEAEAAGAAAVPFAGPAGYGAALRTEVSLTRSAAPTTLTGRP